MITENFKPKFSRCNSAFIGSLSSYQLGGGVGSCSLRPYLLGARSDSSYPRAATYCIFLEVENVVTFFSILIPDINCGCDSLNGVFETGRSKLYLPNLGPCQLFHLENLSLSKKVFQVKFR